MLKRKKYFLGLAILFLIISFASAEVEAKNDEAKQIAKHLKTRYKAKKVKIPFMWLAKFAVNVVRPAGVKSFSVTLYEDLQFSKETLDMEMQRAMRASLGTEWSPIIRVRSQKGQQVYMYMRDDGKNVRLMLVTIENNQAALIRAKFNPEKLAEFINDPKVFGISLNDNNPKSEVEEKKTEQTNETSDTNTP